MTPAKSSQDNDRTTVGTGRLWLIAALTGIWPLIVVNGSLALSIGTGALEPTFPYIDGEASISAAARQDPTIYWFRIAMMPYALVLALFWWLNHRWLQSWQSQRVISQRLMLACGLTGAAFLILYSSFLGTEGVMYGWLRRFGATLYFAGTALAQLIGLRVLWHTSLEGMDRYRPWLRSALTISAALLALGVANAVLPPVVPDSFRIENVIEWHFGLLMSAWFVVLSVLWRQSGYTFKLSANPFYDQSSSDPP